MRRTWLTGLVVFALFIGTAAWADIPQSLHYSGKLDTAGGAFTGTIDVTFSLYADANATDSFWSETLAATVTNGRFHVHLGATTPITAANVDVSALHLGVAVDGDAEMQKVAIASVPYALRAAEAGNSATVGGQSSSEFAAAGHQHEGQYLGDNNPVVSGDLHVNGLVYGNIRIKDTRDVNDAPSAFDKEVSFDFKRREVVTVPGAGTYSAQITLAPWSDNSGGLHHQLNFNEGGIFWRSGPPAAEDPADWGNWKPLVTGLPAAVMVLEVRDVFGVPTMNACPDEWIEADTQLTNARDGYKNWTRTCYTYRLCTVMQLRRETTTTTNPPQYCPSGWIEADYQTVYVTEWSDRVRTCYLCN